MLRLFCGTVVTFGATAFLVASSPGGDNKPAGQSEALAGDVELLTDAFTLAETAQKRKLPEAYVAAGRLLLRFEKQTGGKLGKIDAKFKAEDENGKPISDAKVGRPEAESFAELAEKYFADAAALAVEQNSGKAVRDLINAAKNDPGGVAERGVVGGPKMIARMIGPGQMHQWAFVFASNVPGIVGFQATAPCRCRMVDGANGHVFFDQTVPQGKYGWLQKSTLPSRLIVVTINNAQKVPVSYRLLTN